MMPVIMSIKFTPDFYTNPTNIRIFKLAQHLKLNPPIVYAAPPDKRNKNREQCKKIKIIGN